MASAETPSDAPRSPLEVALGVFTEVRAGEGVTALLLTLNVLLLLTAYYVIKPVREGLLGEMGEVGADYKAYLAAVIAVALLFAVPAYSSLANRVARNRLVVGVTLFFASNLGVFFVLAKVPAVRGYLGLLFYVWVGIFNMMVVAQFWAFANDLYTEEQGKRLFAMVGLGASVGAAAGSAVSAAFSTALGIDNLLLLSAVFLVVFAGIIQYLHVRESGRQGGEAPEAVPEPAAEKPAETDGAAGSGAFAMVFRYRYLTLLALFSLLFTLVNSNGEWMLSRLIIRGAAEAVASGAVEADAQGAYISQQFGSFFLGVNILGVFLQAVVVSRLVKYAGLGPTFFILPVIAFLDAGAVAAVPALAVLWWGKTAENATDYSINNTVRNMLWLPTTREMKYRAKQAVDTFFVRMGDVSSGLVVFAFATLELGVRQMAILNLGLVLVWLILAAGILREKERLPEILAKEAEADPLGPAPA